MSTLDVKIETAAAVQHDSLVWANKTYVPKEAVTKEQLKAAKKKNSDHVELTLTAAPTTSPKKLKKTPDEDYRDSVYDFLKLRDAISDFTPASILVLMVLVCQVIDLWAPLMTVPVIHLKGAASIPPYVSILLNAVQGPEELHGKGWLGDDWFLRRPWSIRPIIPIGSSAASADLWDYIGGKCMPFYKNKKFYVPYLNKTFALSPGLPGSVKRGLAELSPLAIPITCTSLKLGDRPVIELDGTAFFVYDKDLLSQIEDSSWLFFEAWQEFLVRLRKKRKRLQRILDDADSFRPAKIAGRFSQVETGLDTSLISLGLSLMKAFLQYTVDQYWLSRDEANDIFMEYWSLALPASAPTPAGCGASWREPDVLRVALVEYIAEGIDTIAAPNGLCTEKTSGKIHELAGEYYYVTPRKRFADAYLVRLEAQGISPPKSLDRYDLEFQKALQEAGIPCKNGGRDTTWKNAFFTKGHTPEGTPTSIPCLAIPLVHLPEQALLCLRAHFGDIFDAWCPVAGTVSSTDESSARMEVTDCE